MGCLLIVLALVLVVVSPALLLFPALLGAVGIVQSQRKREAELAVDYWKRKGQREDD